MKKSDIKKSSRRPRGRRAVIRRALAKSWKRSVAKVCKRVISRQVEVKSAQLITAVSPKNFLVTNTDYVGNNVFCITPTSGFISILQGDGQSDRTGNQIRTKSCKAKIVLYPKPYDSVVNNNPKPTIVTFWCVSPKSGYMSPATMADTFDVSMWQSGSSFTGYQSQLYDMTIPINKDVLTVHFVRSYKLGHASNYGTTAIQSNASNSTNAQYSTNEYKLNHIINFDFTRFLPKTIKFNDNSALSNAKTVYLIVGIANADGTTFSSGTGQQPVDMWMTLDYKYTDA